MYSWDTRCKIVSCFTCIILYTLLHNNLCLMLGFACTIIVAFACRVPMKVIIKRATHAIPFLLIMGMPFIFRGDWAFAYTLWLKALVGILYAIIMTTHADEWEFWKALSGLKCPRILISILFISLRYIHLFINRLQHMKNALTARGFRPSLSFKALRSYGNLSGHFIVSAFDQSERLNKAMSARGFKIALPLPPPAQIPPKQIGISLFPIIVYGVLIYVQYT